MEIVLTTKVRTNTQTFVKTVSLKQGSDGEIKTNVDRFEMNGIISNAPFSEPKVYLIKKGISCPSLNTATFFNLKKEL